nr:MAG TPA: helix-turn-helix domain protein [Caudoviricetes sp.]
MKTNENIEEFGARLKSALKRKNMSQSKLSEISGINTSTISEYISGRYEPSRSRIAEFANVLDVNEVWLMGYNVPMERGTFKRDSKDSDFVLSNGIEYEIKIIKGKIIIYKRDRNSLKEMINLDDEKNFKLKNALRLLETIIEDIKLDSESMMILERLIAHIVINNYHIEKYNTEEFQTFQNEKFTKPINKKYAFEGQSETKKKNSKLEQTIRKNREKKKNETK